MPTKNVPVIADADWIDAAQRLYADGSDNDIELDEDAAVSVAVEPPDKFSDGQLVGGAWVRAWVWVPVEEIR